jgi:hypothetical protein
MDSVSSWKWNFTVKETNHAISIATSTAATTTTTTTEQQPLNSQFQFES